MQLSKQQKLQGVSGNQELIPVPNQPSPAVSFYNSQAQDTPQI